MNILFFAALIFFNFADSCHAKPSGNIIDIAEYKGGLINTDLTVYGCNAETSQTFKANSVRFVLYNCKFNSNKGDRAGAIDFTNLGCNLDVCKQVNLITKCQFINCESGDEGGAIYTMLMSEGNYFEIKDSTFENCKSGKGGAISYACNKGIFDNCKFIHNTATQSGNDFYITQLSDDAVLSITNCEFEVHSSSSCMIYMMSYGQYNFEFKDNKMKIIENTHNEFHLFDSMTDSFQGTLKFSGNCMSPADDKNIIKGPKAQSLNLDLNNDFVLCQTSPDTPNPPDSCHAKPSGKIIDIAEYKGGLINTDLTVYGCNAETSQTFKANSVRFVLYNCKFNSNKGDRAGAIDFTNLGCNLDVCKQVNLITKCQFINCESGDEGGAIYTMLMSEGNYFEIKDSTFENCKSGKGGAISYACNKGIFDNCKFIHNTATQSGNDFYITQLSDDAVLSITNCEFEVHSSSSCMIYMMSYGQYNFEFKDNKMKIIENTHNEFHLFDSMTDSFQGTLKFSGNCMSPADDKNIIKGPKAQSLNLDLNKDFVLCQTSPDTPNPPDTFEPFVPSNQDVIVSSKCESNGRCDYEEKANEAIYVFVDLSSFKDITSTGVNGGALNVKNAGLNVNKTTFTNCRVNNGGGGAIYAVYSYEHKNSIKFDNIKFVQNKAAYGGAVYVFSKSAENYVLIQSCAFNSNSLISSSEAPLSGGSAMYLTVNVGSVKNCQFNGEGTGSLIVSSENFDEVSSLKRINTLNRKSSLLISNSVFNQCNKESTSIYYIGGENAGHVEVKSCIFKGKLAKGSRFIDGELSTKDSQKMIVNSCKFENYDVKTAVNDNIAEVQRSEKTTNLLAWTLNNLVEIAFCATILTIVALFVIMNKKKPTKMIENENETENENENDNENDI